MNQRNEILTIGKYKNKTIGEVCLLDPGYLLWMDKTIDSFSLNDHFYYRCLELKEEIDNDTLLDASWGDIH